MQRHSTKARCTFDRNFLYSLPSVSFQRRIKKERKNDLHDSFLSSFYLLTTTCFRGYCFRAPDFIAHLLERRRSCRSITVFFLSTNHGLSAEHCEWAFLTLELQPNMSLRTRDGFKVSPRVEKARVRKSWFYTNGISNK